MSLISTAVLLQVADRAAMQCKYIYDAFTSLTAEGGGYYADIITATEDHDVEIPTQGPYHYVDDTLSADLAIQGNPFCFILSAMEAHFNLRDNSGAALQPGGWNGYLQDHDERVSYYFARMFYAVKNVYMMANNVFSESDDLFATAVVAAGPAITFTDGINYGTGAATNPADGTYYAATQLKVRVTSMGATAVDLRLSVKDESNNPTTIDVTIPGGSPALTEVSVGTSSDRFLDVIGIGFVPAGSTGTFGDTFTVRNLKERQIAL